MTPNEQFETQLTIAARENLHSGIDVGRYVTDELRNATEKQWGVS